MFKSLHGLIIPLDTMSSLVILSFFFIHRYSLEDSNKQLLYEVQQKDEDILLLQDELRQLTERMNAINKEYSEDICESGRPTAMVHL